MSKTVSNDALWGKLSEISEQLKNLAIEQKSQVSSSEQVENPLDFSGGKDEIFAKIEGQTTKLGKHYA